MMEVTAIYRSTNPSCDMLNLYRGPTLIARIHDQLWIENVLGPQQRKRWYDGQYIFDVSSQAIDDAWLITGEKELKVYYVNK